MNILMRSRRDIYRLPRLPPPKVPGYFARPGRACSSRIRPAASVWTCVDFLSARTTLVSPPGRWHCNSFDEHAKRSDIFDGRKTAGKNLFGHQRSERHQVWGNYINGDSNAYAQAEARIGYAHSHCYPTAKVPCSPRSTPSSPPPHRGGKPQLQLPPSL
jgi:hypothetical protein